MRLATLHPVRSCSFALFVSVLGCGQGQDDSGHEAEEGVPTESTCPTGSTLTYDNFGREFFDSYCQRCHGGDVTGADRNGAPADHAFDQVEHIRAFTDHIDERAAAGPAAVNEIMPPSGLRPTEAERLQLGEWLACGAP